LDSRDYQREIGGLCDMVGEGKKGSSVHENGGMTERVPLGRAPLRVTSAAVDHYARQTRSVRKKSKATTKLRFRKEKEKYAERNQNTQRTRVIVEILKTFRDVGRNIQMSKMMIELEIGKGQ
jgi:hypothetical protein